MKRLVFFALATALCACGSSNNNSSGGGGGGSPDSGTPSGGATISISNLTWSPADMTVDAGTTITLVNNDSTNHTFTSETADNMFTAGAVGGVSFDVTIPAATGGSGGPYGGGGGGAGTATVTIPSTAASGTVIPFFCNIHKSSMSPPNGHITIR